MTRRMMRLPSRKDQVNASVREPPAILLSRLLIFLKIDSFSARIAHTADPFAFSTSIAIISEDVGGFHSAHRRRTSLLPVIVQDFGAN